MLQHAIAAFAQPPNAAPATLRVSGEVTKPLSLTLEALGKLNKTEVKAKDKDGKEHRYTGEGPIRLVVPADKKQARWVRQATTIKVLSAKE